MLEHGPDQFWAERKLTNHRRNLLQQPIRCPLLGKRERRDTEIRIAPGEHRIHKRRHGHWTLGPDSAGHQYPCLQQSLNCADVKACTFTHTLFDHALTKRGAQIRQEFAQNQRKPLCRLDIRIIEQRDRVVGR